MNNTNRKFTVSCFMSDFSGNIECVKNDYYAQSSTGAVEKAMKDIQRIGKVPLFCVTDSQLRLLIQKRGVKSNI